MTSRYWYNLALTRWELLHGVDQGPVDPFTLRVTKPDATNTGLGIIAPAPTTVWSGDISATTAGDVIENLVVTGNIIIRAPNVTVRNCEILVGARSSNSWGVFCTSGFPGTRVEYTTIHGSNPSVWLNGIGPMNYTAYRCRLYDLVDGFSTFAPATSTGVAINASMQGCFVDQLLYISPDPNHSDNHTHSDDNQYQGGDGGQMIGNNMRGYLNMTLSTSPPNTRTNSAIQLGNATGLVTNIAVEDNWFAGGQYTINGGGGASGGAFTGHIWRNKFARDSVLNVPIGLNQNCGGMDTGDGTANQNVWEDTLTPIPVSRNK